MTNDTHKSLIVYYVNQILRTYNQMPAKELKRISNGLANLIEFHRYNINTDALNKMGRKDLL